MATDHRGLGIFNGVKCRLRSAVSQIDDDPQSVHLMNHGKAKFRQPAVLLRTAGSNLVLTIMGELNDPDTDVIQHPQPTQISFDWFPILHTQ